MTVNELKMLLAGVDGDRMIVLSRDSEGNRFSPLADIDDNSVYVPITEVDGEVGIEKLDEDLERLGYTSEDVISGLPALVLWPKN